MTVIRGAWRLVGGGDFVVWWLVVGGLVVWWRWWWWQCKVNQFVGVCKHNIKTMLYLTRDAVKVCVSL
jgi:hypothetical protein